VQSSKLHANTANEGGAIYKLSGDLIVRDSTLDQNVADYGEGSAIWSLDGKVTIRRSLLAVNDATYAGLGEGGGIFMQGGTGELVVTNSTFSGNTAWPGALCWLSLQPLLKWRMRRSLTIPPPQASLVSVKSL
jgi:hypothetical protein